MLWDWLAETSTVSLIFIGWILVTLSRWAAQRTNFNSLIAERIGVVVFLIWIFANVLHYQNLEFAHLIESCLHGLGLGMVSCGTYGLTAISLGELWEHLWVVPSKKRQAARAMHRKLQAEQNQRLEQARLQSLKQAEWERTRPERERAEREAQLRNQHHQLQETANTARREAKALDLKILFDRHRNELEGRLSQKEFKAYFKSFLTSETDVQTYEERAEQVAEMIRSLASVADPQKRPEFKSLEEILTYYTQQIEIIRNLPQVDEETHETLICLLEEARDQTMEEFLL